MVVRLCTISSGYDHLVEVPLEQAQVAFTLDRGDLSTVVLVAEADIGRARAALERFGTFRVEETP